MDGNPIVDIPDIYIERCSEIPNNSDTISRRDAVDALCAVCGNACDKSEFIYNAPQDEQVILCPEHYCLCTLPSAHPEIIHCKDCKHWIDKSCESDDMWMSMYEDVSAFTRFNTNEDFFCGFAERREK